MKTYLPILLDISNKDILLIGGGKSALEKLRTLSQLNKKVRVISDVFLEEFRRYDFLELIERKYETGDMDPYSVIYCGINDPEEEYKIFLEARKKGKLINFIDQVDSSDFISASSLIYSNFTIFISTYGKSPGGAKMIREEIENKMNLSQINSYVGKLAEERLLKKQKSNSGVRDYATTSSYQI
ncbi:MAG: bifunctional precorrin-2 dehydrogenase/sirohydrochlorin ferrochelatase [Leptospiraceae bacterium]|nr:bifunctional precorrin-2 dehydrogenase/sirohydrochlorin ferrochelatase [Leptospiraceae bacterium]MCP5512211.1 bifunctional precorrin-2 dehydrogenase/sirohydrochlorin ferrochelatase [Leptospiraceae bacterium]